MILVTSAGARALFARQLGKEQMPQIPSTTQIPDASGTGRLGQTPRVGKPALKEQLKEKQKNLRRDAGHLLELAQELKDEADKTEEKDVLSLSLIHKAEEIEKLAKQIKSLARLA
jgi:hypothetical protein